jgi:hypothetical protein
LQDQYAIKVAEKIECTKKCNSDKKDSMGLLVIGTGFDRLRLNFRCHFSIVARDITGQKRANISLLASERPSGGQNRRQSPCPSK